MSNSPIKPVPPGTPLSRQILLDGVTVLVDKPATWTSFDVVNKIRATIRHRYQIRKIKVGHAGTLDPLATGLLIVCIGKHTKRIQELMGLDKTYEGRFMLGATTPSYDSETEPDARYPIEHIDQELLDQTVAQFRGRISQKPPLYSAIKQDGKRLYRHAREGRKVEIKPREVVIHDFRLTNINLPEIDFVVRCSKGTYIRSLAHDFGKALHSGAYLAALKRTAIGPYRLEQAWQLPDLVATMRVER